MQNNYMKLIKKKKKTFKLHLFEHSTVPMGVVFLFCLSGNGNCCCQKV